MTISLFNIFLRFMTNAKKEYYKNVFNKIVYPTDFDVRKTQHGINDPRV